MKPQRPAGALVLGILNIVFGLTGLVAVLFCGVGAIVMFSVAVNQPPPKGDPLAPFTVYFRLLNDELPSYRPYFIGFSIFGAIDQRVVPARAAR